jgi:hypothetical protein
MQDLFIKNFIKNNVIQVKVNYLIIVHVQIAIKKARDICEEQNSIAASLFTKLIEEKKLVFTCFSTFTFDLYTI